MRILAVFLAGLILSALVCAQGVYSRRRPSAATATTGPYQDPPVTFYGKIKTITKKEITIDLDSEEQTLTMRRSGKTRFSRNGQKVEAADIPAGTHVSIDAVLEGDQKVAALSVMVTPAAKPAQP